MNALCLGLAGVIWAQLPLAEFTLAWQHSVEKIRWEEDYQLSPTGLLLREARVRGSGAGMEIPDEAVLRDGSWHYRPQLPPLQPLRLGRSSAAAAGDYQLCSDAGCRPLADWLGPPSPQRPVVELWSCQPSVG
ncbi:DUF1850 domain-containing protein [Pseudomonas sp. MYb185]|uniref:DUF1850 domain-containing protein n=1 Tax=Pseudomonas sp. MYb185 TaxID=1848729 RepID=UPI000CFA8C11|nr:DUF1850 domain-containing protein [Pseudomonas sp. MYb185]PRB82813.1 hypothetical protein CQ007_05825 [Pseudomonas sp. MYb185]